MLFGLEAGTQRDAESAVRVDELPPGVVHIHPERPANGQTGTHRTGGTFGAFDAPTHAATESPALTNPVFAAHSQNSTRPVPKVDRVQVKVYSKDQASSREHGQAGSRM